MLGSTSMSLGSDTATGPGRPAQAVCQARLTISPTLSGSSISVVHLVIDPKNAG